MLFKSQDPCCQSSDPVLPQKRKKQVLPSSVPILVRCGVLNGWFAYLWTVQHHSMKISQTGLKEEQRLKADQLILQQARTRSLKMTSAFRKHVFMDCAIFELHGVWPTVPGEIYRVETVNQTSLSIFFGYFQPYNGILFGTDRVLQKWHTWHAWYYSLSLLHLHLDELKNVLHLPLLNLQKPWMSIDYVWFLRWRDEWKVFSVTQIVSTELNNIHKGL